MSITIDFGAMGSVTDLRQGSRWTAEDLARASEHTAALLRPMVTPDRPHVVIAHGGTPMFFADLFGVWEAGGCAVCVNPGLTASEMSVIGNFLNPAAVLIGEDDGPVVPDGVPGLCSSREKVNETSVLSGNLRTLDDPALILFTSGTTGAPKGVVHSLRSLLARIGLNRVHMGDASLVRSLCVLPTHFGHGLIGNCLTPLFAGGELLLRSGMAMEEMVGLGATLAEHDVTFMSSVPAFWPMALRLSTAPSRPCLQRVHIGSAPLSSALWRDVAHWSGTDSVVNMYGITETANWIAGASLADTPPEDGLIGTMWGGCAAVLSDDGTMRSRGEGEILVQTPSLMIGYHARPDLTEPVLRSGWYHTGDSGHIDGDGRIRLIGRRKSEINKAGVKVHPEEVDLLLERHPGVAEACCFSVPDPVSGEIVGVAVTLVAGETDGQPTPAIADLRDWCRARIKAECVPDRWFTVAEIPRTDRGKVNRDRVRDHCLRQGPG